MFYIAKRKPTLKQGQKKKIERFANVIKIKEKAY